MYKTTTFRIRLQDWKRLRKIFAGEKVETVADYMNRLIKFLESKK